MIVLGFDTSTRCTTVALRLADASALHARDDPAAGEHPGHATRLLGMADDLLARAGISWAALERIAVGRGPGRFTGLRVGIATARGLAQSLTAELVGVSTLQALAEAALRGEHGADRVLAVIDALRGEVFASGFLANDRGAVCELAIPQALGPEHLAEEVSRASSWRSGRWLAVGDGALRYRSELESAGAAVPDDSSPLHLLDARTICDIGARSPAAHSCEELLPDYRRRPDAERRRGAGGEPVEAAVSYGAPR